MIWMAVRDIKKYIELSKNEIEKHIINHKCDSFFLCIGINKGRAG